MRFKGSVLTLAAFALCASAMGDTFMGDWQGTFVLGKESKAAVAQVIAVGGNTYEAHILDGFDVSGKPLLKLSGENRDGVVVLTGTFQAPNFKAAFSDAAGEAADIHAGKNSPPLANTWQGGAQKRNGAAWRRNDKPGRMGKRAQKTRALPCRMGTDGRHHGSHKRQRQYCHKAVVRQSPTASRISPAAHAGRQRPEPRKQRRVYLWSL
jgi:hypothetical protein